MATLGGFTGDLDNLYEDCYLPNFCEFSDKIINKDFLVINKSFDFGSRDINYLIITNNELLPAANSLKLIHTTLPPNHY